MSIMVRSAPALLLFMVSSVFAAQSQYHCDVKIVQAITVDKQKEVRICLSQGKVAYMHGSVNQDKPDVDIRVPPHNSRFEYNKYLQTIEVDYGKFTYTYEYFPEMDIRKRLTGYIVINDVFVYHNTHPIEAFHFPKETKHAITPKLSQYGLKNITNYRRK